MDPTRPTAITYENVSDSLVEHIPDLREEYQRELKWWGNQRPGAHVVYGDILNPYIDQLLRSGDEAKLKHAFEFVEMLASSADTRIQEIVAVTVCEYLGNEPARVQAARPFMGPRTVKLSREVERFWGHT